MKTQGISLVTSKMSGMGTAKSTRAKDTTFDSFMASRASGVETGKAKPSREAGDSVSVQTSAKKAVNQDENTSGDAPVSADRPQVQGMTAKKPVAEQSPEDKMLQEQDLPELVSRMMNLLKEKFGLSDEEIQDMLTKLGMDLQAFAFQMNWADGSLQQTAVFDLKELVMEFHGIEDSSVFLTNSDLNQELTSLAEDMAELMMSFADEMSEGGEGTDVYQMIAEELPAQMETQPVRGEEAPVPVQNLSEETAAVPEEAADKTEGFSVVVEDYTAGGSEDSAADSGAGDGTAEMRSGTAQTAETGRNTDSHEAAGAASLFTERLAQAFEPETEAIAPAERSMVDIVEQVVRQVRIRVMPDTTSLELQLHPASLGRVSIQVSSVANGAATAVLAVENQMAKEALESQLIALKQSFEEQGLKVDAVEVTVSEFGLNREQQQAGQEQSGRQQRGRRFRAEAGSGLEREDDTAEVTEASRRDVSSTVDYTA